MYDDFRDPYPTTQSTSSQNFPLIKPTISSVEKMVENWHILRWIFGPESAGFCLIFRCGKPHFLRRCQRAHKPDPVNFFTLSPSDSTKQAIPVVRKSLLYTVVRPPLPWLIKGAQTVKCTLWTETLEFGGGWKVPNSWFALHGLAPP